MEAWKAKGNGPDSGMPLKEVPALVLASRPCAWLLFNSYTSDLSQFPAKDSKLTADKSPEESIVELVKERLTSGCATVSMYSSTRCEKGALQGEYGDCR